MTKCRDDSHGFPVLAIMESMTRTIDIAVIPGDGIGPEVVREACKVLESAVALCDTIGNERLHIQFTRYELGAERYHRTGEILPDAELEEIKRHHAILLGAVGDPSVPSGLLERGLLLKLRFALDHYVNLRPSRHYPGVPTPLAAPGAIDFLVVREGTEGLYCGNGGVMRQGTPHEVATEVSVNTAYGVERVVRYAFSKAVSRSRKKLTYVHKHNVLVNAGGLWRRIVQEVGAEYPDVAVDYLHVDAATIFLLTDPGRFDVLVTDNLFGDILTDEAGAVTGGIGLAASGNIPKAPTRRCSSLSTGRLRTSPGGIRPIPPQRYPPRLCFSTIWGIPAPHVPSRQQSRPIWRCGRRQRLQETLLCVQLRR